MTTTKRVLVIGLQPTLTTFAEPDYAIVPGLDAGMVMAALDADKAQLLELGYEAEMCLVDSGESVEEVVRERLQHHRFDGIVIAADLRTTPAHLVLFEQLLNVIHQHAPDAAIAFSRRGDDTAEAVRRRI